ncbi:phytoene desaturase family protein [Streptomyces sp. NPDC085929]|uniref:phytoene desaturase family protein n=1 Tax=Streptomyces sp. NPDC085929 TaxID=3365739 RepID=UPI0037D944C1
MLAHPLADGRCAALDRLPQDTAAGLDQFAPDDGDARTDLCMVLDRLRPDVVQGLFTPFPPLVPRPGSPGRRAPREGWGSYGGCCCPCVGWGRRSSALKRAASSSRATPCTPTCPRGGRKRRLRMAHVDARPAFRLPRPLGGAGQLTAALVRRLEGRGGAVRCGTPVIEVVVRAGRAVGVRTASGEGVPARRAVLADVSAPALYGSLVGEEHLPQSVLHDLRRFQSFKVDWALDSRVPWSAPQAATAGTVHLCTCTQVHRCTWPTASTA